MTIAIKFGDSNVKTSITGVIYFDVVTKYQRQYGGKVTEHPLEAGASITDHYIANNKKYNIEGIISGVDFSTIDPNITIDGEPILNKNVNNTPVEIPSTPLIDKFIPDVISQFIGQASPTPVLTGNAKSYNKEIEQGLATVLHGLYYNEQRKKWENRMTLVTLFELDGPTISNTIENLAVTSFSVNEDAQTGDGLSFSMTLEQVTFVKLENAEAPRPAAGSKTGRATTNKTNGGNVNSDEGIVPPKERDRQYADDLFNKSMGGGN